jgi:type II secretory pathway pseudopilin PulG
MRKGFSMLTAIVVIVLMASVTALVFNISGKTIQETAMQYRKEQAILLAKSYTEYAILAVQGYDMAANGCLATVRGLINTTQLAGVNANGADNGEGYRVTVRIQYLNLAPAIACAGATLAGNDGTSIPTALIDVNVRYRDMSAIDAQLSAGQTLAQARDAAPFINYNRRTLQKL